MHCNTAESMSGVTAYAVIIDEKVRKGAGRMPWLTEAMKDVISCDKPRLGANNL